jgi:hypothetical protein
MNVAVRIGQTRRREGEMMREEDEMMGEEAKIQKIIDRLPPSWSRPGYDPHRGIERFRAATGQLPESAEELDKWTQDWIARNVSNIPVVMLVDMLEHRNVRVMFGPALSDAPLDQIVEALRLRRRHPPKTAPVKRSDIIETARLAWGDSPDRWPQWPQWAHDAYWAATD